MSSLHPVPATIQRLSFTAWFAEVNDLLAYMGEEPTVYCEARDHYEQGYPAEWAAEHIAALRLGEEG